MRERGIPHRGFAQLAIIVSYLEMIAKYKDGYLGESESSKYFKQGMLYTFSEIPDNEKDLLEVFYKHVRNGLYHLGITRPKVILFDKIPGSIGFHHENGELVTSPDKFVNDISIRFEAFSQELRKPTNIELRRNFEARFNKDNAPKYATNNGTGKHRLQRTSAPPHVPHPSCQFAHKLLSHQ